MIMIWLSDFLNSISSVNMKQLLNKIRLFLCKALTHIHRAFINFTDQ